MLGITYDEKNAEKALRAISQFATGSSADDFRLQFFTRLGALVLTWIGQNFESGGQLVGGWAPLRPLTLFGRRGGSSLPLSNTGLLKQSFVVRASANELSVGSPSRIAAYHNFGTRPYDIYPRYAKALAFPAPPGGGGGLYVRTRPKGTPRTGIIGRARGGGDLQSFAVVRHVHHPGLPARRMIPVLNDIRSLIGQAIQELLRDFRRR